MKENREKIIIKTSIIGIIANIMLASFKAVIGLISHSIAIVLDAVNNLTDLLSALITIIGAKLAGKEPDKEHPYGHGRMEYLSAMLISIIILYAGAVALTESIKKIINPEIPDYSSTTLIIVIAAIAVKIFLGLYYRKKGTVVNSESLLNSGTDALMDAIISTSTLVAAIIYITSGLCLEAYLGVIISLVIIRAGITMLKSTISQILGERVDKTITNPVKQTVTSFDGVYGAYDLILNNYGPDMYMGSIHIEVADKMTASQIDELTRKIMQEVYEKHGVILTAVGIYCLNSEDKEAIEIREQISNLVHSYKSVLQMHGFYLNRSEKQISFDIILDFEDKNKQSTYKQINCQKHPKFKMGKLSETQMFYLYMKNFNNQVKMTVTKKVNIYFYKTEHIFWKMYWQETYVRL